MTKVTPQMYYLIFLTPASEIHSHIARYAANQNFFKPSVLTSCGISALKFLAVKIRESIPPELKCSLYILFNKHYKSFLLTTQN